MSDVLKLPAREGRAYQEIPVLFEDAHLLVLDKPAGVLTSPDRLDPARPSLMHWLHEDIKRSATWARTRAIEYLACGHRPDAETSGVLVLARTKAALIKLADLFGTGRPLLIHLVLCQGVPAADSFRVDAPIGHSPRRPGAMAVSGQQSKKAMTLVEVGERFTGYTLLKCSPLTWRPHQIRVHLKNRQLPVAGDTLYGGRPLWLSRLKPDFHLKPGKHERPLIGEPLVHAEVLTMVHPLSGVSLTVTAPWPKDLSVAVKYLRRYAPAAAPGASVSPVLNVEPGA